MGKKKEEPLPQIEGYEPVQRTISILAGYRGTRHRFTVRGQIRPANTTTQSLTH